MMHESLKTGSNARNIYRKTQCRTGKPLTTLMYLQPVYRYSNWNTHFQGFVVLWFNTFADGIPDLISWYVYTITVVNQPRWRLLTLLISLNPEFEHVRPHYHYLQILYICSSGHDLVHVVDTSKIKYTFIDRDNVNASYVVLHALTDLTAPHVCVCPKPVPGFPTTSVVVYLLLCPVS